jgi:hypothetical protein
MDPEHRWHSAAEVLEAAEPSRNVRIWTPYVMQAFQSGPALRATQLLERFVELWGEDHGIRTPSVWIDHTPGNIAMTHTLLRHWPHAKFIHLVRDGRAVAASVSHLSWGPATVLGAANWWTRAIAQGLAAEAALGSRIQRVRYEDLVLDTEESLGRLCKFLRLDYEPGMPSGYGFDPPEWARERSNNELVGQPPSKDRAASWEHELSGREVEIFEAMTGEVLWDLGYDLKFGGSARKPSTMETARFALHEAWNGLCQLIAGRAAAIGDPP